MGSMSLTDFTRTWVTEEKGYVDGEGERERGIKRLQRDYILNERFFGWASGEWHSLNGDGRIAKGQVRNPAKKLTAAGALGLGLPRLLAGKRVIHGSPACCFAPTQTSCCMYVSITYQVPYF